MNTMLLVRHRPLPAPSASLRLRDHFRFIALVLLACALCFGTVARAQAVQPIPPLAAHVLDATGTLSAEAKQALETKLTAFERSHGSQIAMLVVPTTKPETVDAYALRVADAWRLGRLGVGDGVLVVVARDDRRVRIEVAQSLKGTVSDSFAKTLIETAMQPAFRQGDYARGLDAAANQLIARLTGAGLPLPYGTATAPVPAASGAVRPPDRRFLGSTLDGFQWLDMAIFLFVAVAVAARPLRNTLGRKIGSLVLGTGVGAVALFSTGSLLLGCIAAFVALLWGLLSGNDSTPRQTRIDARHARAMGHRSARDAGDSGWGTMGGFLGGAAGLGGGGGSGRAGYAGDGGHFGGGTSSDGGGSFHSGGGGEFGGGGASGDW